MEKANAWYFGTSTGGMVQGANSGTGELFSGKDIFSSTVKEVIQNSLDAQVSPDRPVTVQFELKNVQTAQLPGYRQICFVMEEAIRYWSSKSQTETAAVLKNRLEILRSHTVPVLIVSDYNTTGLSDPMNEDIQQGDWNALVRMNGGGTKTGTKNGSKGLGKNAPFALSQLGMVFYRTITQKQERAAQGVIHLVSYPDLSSSRKDAFYNSVGYFGQGNRPVRELSWISGLSFRKDSGTDVVIVGFPANNAERWKTIVIRAVLENYMLAICKGNLVVKAGSSIIDRSSLEKHLTHNSTTKRMRDTLSFYRAVCADSAMVQKFQIPGLEGNFAVHYLFQPRQGEELASRILYTRESGMKLFEKPVQSAVSFCAVVEMEGRSLSEYFRSLEPATHDSWKADLDRSSPDLARSRIDMVHKKVNELAETLMEQTHSESVDLEFLGEPEKLKRETTLETRDARAFGGRSSGILTRNPESRQKVRRQPKKVGGTIKRSGSLSGEKAYEGHRRTKRQGHSSRKGVRTEDGIDPIFEPAVDHVTITAVQSRAIALKTGQTRLMIFLPDELKNARISVRAMGDGTNGYPVRISKIIRHEGVSGPGLSKDSRSILVEKMEGNRLISIDFQPVFSLKNRSLSVHIEGE